MTLVESIAAEVEKEIAASYQYFSLPQREAIRRLIVRKFAPVCPEPQERFSFDTEDKKSADQREKILALLKKRRQEGATNVELADIALKYTGRVSELRRTPYNYTIICTKEKGRVTRYRLHAFQW